MTTAEVASILRVHRNTVDAERKAGKLACVRIGTRVLFTKQQILEYIHRQQRVDRTGETAREHWEGTS